MRRANVLSGVILAVFGLVMLFAVIPWEIGAGPDGMMSPRLVPSLMMVVVVGLSLLLVINNIRARPDDLRSDRPMPISRGEIAALIKISAVFAIAIGLYLWLTPLAGGAALVFGALWVLGERRPIIYAVMPPALLTAIWFLFYKVLGTGIV
ncbi:tripartite tricarboxylate transporter TctB family protein [uncultured Roseibium sp.]|uniref:tripartite tricarboxylate transporter TctB family protein n=1 Tax=uncultured Roseibium sp. TaxID=1936171 RepID=UPI003216955B